MYHRSGSNPYEPYKVDHHSRVWQFVLRFQSCPDAAKAFFPHANLCAFISSPQGNSGYHLLRGVVQFNSTRTYGLLKRRYSKQAEWIPTAMKDLGFIQEYTTRPIPVNATRYTNYNPSPMPLPRVGLISVPDLLEDYLDALAAQEIEEYEDSKGYERFVMPSNYIPPPPSPPRQPLNEEFWIDGPDGQRYFLARFVNDELIFEPP